MPGKTSEQQSSLMLGYGLQWGPGRMPGKTPDNDGQKLGDLLLQWGPGRMPGKTRVEFMRSPVRRDRLQWGPGRMPGKTVGVMR